MRFDWDSDKAEKNLAKHGVRFEDAMFAFFDPFGRIEIDIAHAEEEDRYWQIGMTRAGLLIVVYTIRQPDDAYRIITARRANRKERQRYENFKRI
jgi:uncharacterized DUF497 family protein